MSRRLLSFKTLATALIGVLVAYLLFGWLALPRILQSQAEKYIAERTGHRLILDRPEFNPFELSLRLANLRLEEPDGKPLFGFKELKVDLSAASISRRAIVFDSVRLEEPEATVVLGRDGRLNWSPLIEALKSKQEKPDSALPRFDIQSFVLAGGRINFSDHRADFSTRIESLDLELSDISTLPDDKGRYKVSARTTFGARVLWQGEALLNPLAVAGSLDIENLDLARLAPYLRDKLPMAPPAGSAALRTDYRLGYAAGRLDLTLDKMSAKLTGVRLKAGKTGGPDFAVDAIEAKNGRFDLARNSLSLDALALTGSQVDLPRPTGAPLKLLQLGSLTLEDAKIDLAGRSFSLARVALTGGRLKAVRNAQGRIDVLAAWQAKSRPASGARPAQQPAAAGWRYRVDKVELADFSASFRDEAVMPAANLALDDIVMTVEGIDDKLATSLPVRASFRVRDGGNFEAAGQIVPAEPSVDFKIKLADLALKPAQPYLTSAARLTLASGRLAVDGRATYGKRGAAFRGGFSLRDLRLTETDTGELFLAWKSLGSRDLEATAAQLNIAELSLDGLDTKLIVNKDKSLNVGGIFNKPAGGGAALPAASSAPKNQEQSAAPFLVNIDRLRVGNSEMDFADLSLALPFGTRVHHLRGAIIGLSSRAGSPGQIELEGQVDDYGLARAVGQVDLFNPTEFTDLKVVFRNVEMTRLTPYSATFAGRKIDSGKLSLDLEYKIKKRQLAGENRIVMDQLTLGERVESPQAKNLPLDLAIAILQDSDGRIDLGLPVSGSLDDPQFSYGSIIWKTIVNVIGKIATAPFRALGALFGGGEKFESIAFDFGDTQLTPPEREKLVRLAGALGKRPGLSLTMHGVYADADRVSLQERQLRRTVAERAGQRMDGQEHAGPLSTRTPKIQAALESLYAERVGSGELAALKAGFRKANPGQLEEGVAGKMISRLSGLLREKRVLDEKDTARLQGADFHAVLFERLRDREPVADAQLQTLAQARGEHALAALKAAGAPPERLILAAPEKVASEGRDVALKLVLGTAPKQTAAAAASH